MKYYYIHVEPKYATEFQAAIKHIVPRFQGLTNSAVAGLTDEDITMLKLTIPDITIDEHNI